MNKSHFIDFVENPSRIREKDADILAELARNYPYSSLVHTLLAKAHAGTPKAKESLASAALHIPDRRVLKEVMENACLQNAARHAEGAPAPPQDTNAAEKLRPALVSAPTAAGNPSRSFSEVNQPEKAHSLPPAPAKSKENVFDELQENLKKLQEQRNRFNHEEEQKETFSEDNPSAPKLETTPREETEDEIKEIPVQQLPERLQEIVLNREVQEINDPKRIEQINLIDSFIEKSSFIARRYRSLNEEENPQNDLTDSYQFAPQDLVTENLAKIMVRQGKTDKAIDIYEKLVLKNPQKKAYFATCIEKLKNNQ